MTISVVPTTPGLPFYNQITTLDGVAYQLVFHWNGRDEHWYLDINNIAGEAIVPSIKIVCNFPLLRHVTTISAPPGELYAYDGTGQDIDPGLDDFGTRIELLYYDFAEMVAFLP